MPRQPFNRLVWHFYFPFRGLNRWSAADKVFVKLLINRLTNRREYYLNTSNSSTNTELNI